MRLALVNYAFNEFIQSWKSRADQSAERAIPIERWARIRVCSRMMMDEEFPFHMVRKMQ